MTSTKSHASKAVDQAFQRLYGYPWGTKESAKIATLPQDLVDIFGKDKVAQILRLPSIGGIPPHTPKDAAMLLTKRITTNNKRKSTMTTTSFAATINTNNNSFKRMRLSAEDYKNIELPKDMVDAKAAAMESSIAEAATTSLTAAA